MSKGLIISLSGIDCAGKTTQLDRLKARLVKEGFAATIVWHRPGYGPELDAARGLLRKLRPTSLPRSSDGGADKQEQGQRQSIFERPLVQKTWTRLALADTSLQRVIKSRFGTRRADQVILWDRGLDDALLDLTLRFPRLDVPQWRTWRWLARASSRPNVRILLMIPKDVMLARQAIKNEPFPDTAEIRERRYQSYTALARTGHYRVIDANQTIDQVHEEIWALVKPVLPALDKET